MTTVLLVGFLQLALIIIGSVVLAIFVVGKLFPPMERTRDNRAPRQTEAKTQPAPLPSVQIEPPPPPVIHTPYVAPVWLDAYWRATLRLIGPLLVIWLISFTVPPLLAASLNHVSVLTGFPLGYYMSAQGSILIFLALTLVYTWRMRRLDQRYGLDPTESPQEQHRRINLFFAYGIFAVGFLVLLAFIGALDALFAIPQAVIGWIFMSLTVGMYAVIGLRARTSRLDEYYVAGRRVPAALNGLATGADWMSAASFISMAGALFLLGYEGLAYITGWTGGYVLLLLLLGPYLRKFGQFTIPDFIGARYPGAGTRVIGALIAIIISFTYLTAQVTGVGIIMSRFFGLNYTLGVTVGLSAVLLCSFLGGMKAITWTQGVQGIILLIAYLVPVTWLSLKLTGVPLPQVMYGEALRHITDLETVQHITPGYVEPFNDWSPLNFIALTLCLMLGTAGMPHILVRFYTVSNVRESRSSVSWALLWIAILYLTAPAYAAFSRWEILQNIVGRPIAALPAWATNWAETGLLTIADAPGDGGNGDGVLQFDELHIDQDLIVLATPEIAGLPATVVALVAAGGMAAALSTADGLLMVIAAAVAHDIYHRTLNPQAGLREQLWVGRMMIVVAATLATLTAVQRLGIIVQLVAWAFSLAAATFFPVLVLGIFWKGATSRGAAAGMLCGLAATVAYMGLTAIFPAESLFGISSIAAGIIGAPVNFLVTWLVSRLGPPTSRATRDLVDSLRHP